MTGRSGLIAREIVSNILVHRDFGSAFPAKLIIERDKIYTENWNRTQRIGKLELEDFTPYPKNPILTKFFINIGYADGLGSGVRNLYKFTKIYSGGEPDLEEGDVFRLTVPLITSESENSAIETDEGILGKINSAIEKNKFSEPTKLKIRLIYREIGKGEAFGTRDIIQIVGCSSSTARELLKKLRKMDVIEDVKGNGKGRYRFISE